MCASVNLLTAANQARAGSPGVQSRSRLRARIEIMLVHDRKFSPIAAAALVLVSLAVSALAPPWVAFAQRLEFEVASVRENTTNGQSDFPPRRSGDRILMHNTRIFSMIFYAYNLAGNYQIEGYERFPEGVKWYDLEALAPKGATEDHVRQMLQALLAERFKLKIRRESKEIQEFELVIDKGKPKLQPSHDGAMQLTIEGKTFSPRPGTCGISLWNDGSHLVCHAAAMDKIVAAVGSQLRAPVVDRTGLTGTYDLHIRYIPDERRLDPKVPPGPTFAQALPEELGLRLEKGKGRVEVLVIDHMEKPSEN
jgi:uncharacterized protein (TIGR03435 family)